VTWRLPLLAAKDCRRRWGRSALVPCVAADIDGQLGFWRGCVRARQRVLQDARNLGVISDAIVATVTADVWSGAEYPQDWLGTTDWLELFAVASFTIDGRPSPRPDKPMSWTSDRGLAQKFAEKGSGDSLRDLSTRPQRRQRLCYASITHHGASLST
jgi:hypothetical protein